MAGSPPGKILTLVALLAPLAQASAAPATIARDRQQQIFMDSQSGYIDLKTNTAVFYKIRISEGGMSITADQGQANQQRSKDLYFEKNVWIFRGNVKIGVEQGHPQPQTRLLRTNRHEDRKACQRPCRHHRLRCVKTLGAVLEGCLLDQR